MSNTTKSRLFLFDPVDAVEIGKRDTIIVVKSRDGYLLPECKTTVEAALGLYTSGARNGQVVAHTTTSRGEVLSLLDFSDVKARDVEYTLQDHRGNAIAMSQLYVPCQDLLKHFVCKLKNSQFKPVPEYIEDQDRGPGLEIQARRLIAATNMGFRVHHGKVRTRPDPCLQVTIRNVGLPKPLASVIGLEGDTYHIPVESPAAALDLIDKKLHRAHMPLLIDQYNANSGLHY